MLVIDASITMAWCFEDEENDVAEEVLDALLTDEATVPAVWSLEVVNVLLTAERRRRMTEAQSARFLELLSALPIAVDHSVSIAEIYTAGQRHKLSAYAASYLVLAERLGARLATLDTRLAAAASGAGVQVIAEA